MSEYSVKECNINNKKLWEDDINAARELHYGSKVIKMLRKEPDFSTRQRILKNARLGKYDIKW